MTPKPMLDSLELQLVQELAGDLKRGQIDHAIAGFEGGFRQEQGRLAQRFRLRGVLTGPDVGPALEALRGKFHGAVPVEFAADITSANRIDKVLIEAMAVRELAGRPQHFEYVFSLVEYLPAPEPVTSAAAPQTQTGPEPAPAPSPVNAIDDQVGTLEVEVLAPEGGTLDLTRVAVRVQGVQADQSSFSSVIRDRQAAVWRSSQIPAGENALTAVASVLGPPQLSGTAGGVVRPGQTTRLTVSLAASTGIAQLSAIHFWFDRAFIDPCLRPVLAQVAQHASANPAQKLVILGHTDKSGSSGYNQSLSERRARAAHAFLTFGRSSADRAAAIAEWDQLRRGQSNGLPGLSDKWAAREYQYILQDLNFYPGAVDGNHGPLTNDAVEAYRCQKGLPPGTSVDDRVWLLLIEDYLGQDSLSVAADRFMDNCPGEKLRWLGCGEEDPLRNVPHAWRPNRRTEFLFLRQSSFPCDIPKPATLDLPPLPQGATRPWCLDSSGNATDHCCFLAPAADPCPSSPGNRLCRPLNTTTLGVQGSIKREDGSPSNLVAMANQRFVLIAPTGEIKQGEQADGRPISARTDGQGNFSFPDMPAGFYSLEVKKSSGSFLVKLAEEDHGQVRGNTVCKQLRSDKDRLDVVVIQAPVLREIVLPVVVHLMTPLDPTSRQVRSCSEPNGNPASQHSRRDLANLQTLLARVNTIWRQARVRFQLELGNLVRETYAHVLPPGGCKVDDNELRLLLRRCAHPDVVNLFLFGDLVGSEPVIGISAEDGAGAGHPGGLALADRFLITGTQASTALTEAQASQMLAHGLGRFLNLNHDNGNDRLMRAGLFDGGNQTIIDNERDRARASKAAGKTCIPLKLKVQGAERIGAVAGHVFMVLQNATGQVRVEAEMPAHFLAPGAGNLTLSDGTNTSTTPVLTIPTAQTGEKTVIATYTPTGGGAVVTARVTLIICTFQLQVTGADPVGNSNGPPQFEIVGDADPNAVVNVTAKLDPAPFCVPSDLISWSGGTQTPDPLRRSLPRTTIGPTTISARFLGVTRSVVLQISIQLEAIRFHHDPNSPATSALQLRKNLTTAIVLPEWLRNVRTNPDDTAIAYATGPATGQTVRIQVRFRKAASGPLSIKARAVTAAGSLLGAVAERRISFAANGDSGFVNFELKNHNLGSTGVGVHQFRWQWQVHPVAGGNWVNSTESRHKIYTVPAVPNRPWRQNPPAADMSQLPWSDALAFACSWAANATDLDAAAGKVTEAIYNLGGSLFEYDCPGGAPTHYGPSNNYDLTNFLERLGGGAGNGRYVNCTDCAMSVSTFANLLGCDLSQSRIEGPFALNAILAIGSSVWQTACGWGGFSYHEVAWKSPWDAGARLFDACLKVDGDSNPNAAPHTPALVADMLFGTPGSGNYLDRLATPRGRSNCQPNPASRQQRRVV